MLTKFLASGYQKKYKVTYMDFYGNHVEYIKTDFGLDYWEFYKKGNFIIDQQIPEVVPSYYEYTISQSDFSIGKEPYKIERLNKDQFWFSKVIQKQDTVSLNGFEVGIIEGLEWQLKR